MLMAGPVIDSALLTTFDIVQATDPEKLSGQFRVSEKGTRSGRIYTYQLQDPVLWRRRFKQPIFTLATREAGSILASYADSRFATAVSVDGDEGSLFCFTTMLAGHTTLEKHGRNTVVTGQSGLVWRPGPGGRLLISENSARTNVFFKVAEIESALEHLLDDHLHQPLDFLPHLDWSTGLAASLRHQLDFVMDEFQREDGIASNPIALASLTDLLVSLVLRGAAHNYTHRLASTAGIAVPVHLRRAEEFMRASATQPIKLMDVAAAAGCSLRTLTAVFRHFRAKTPLAALHAIRLDLARAELALGRTDISVTAVARRYGFTNAARFSAAFSRRFGESPRQIAMNTQPIRISRET